MVVDLDEVEAGGPGGKARNETRCSLEDAYERAHGLERRSRCGDGREVLCYGFGMGTRLTGTV